MATATETKWKSTRTKPALVWDVVWVRRELSGIELAEWDGKNYVNYGASADREGLSVEVLTDVTHWADAEPPAFDYVEE
jgi:hypothetical protein